MMKKYLAMSTIALSSLVLTSTAMAAAFATITITCPVTSGDPSNQLRNFANSFIAGNGNETIDVGTGPQATLVAFRSTGTLPSGTPGNLASYSSLSATFNDDDPSNPYVTCIYSSSNTSFPNFSVNYQLFNGFGAALSSSTASSVTLMMPVGLKR